MVIRFVLLLCLLAAPALAAPAAGDDALGPAANAAFLAANAAKPGVIARPSGLQYRVLRSGLGTRPGGDDVVRIAYRVSLINGTLVDSTAPTLPLTMSMAGLSLAALSEALPLMHVGDRWQLVIPANLAFGPRSAMNGAVPPNQTLVMDLTLVSAAPPRPGETVGENPFSVWGRPNGGGAAFTFHP